MAVSRRVSLGFLPIFFAWVLSKSLERPAFLCTSTPKGCHLKALGRYPTEYGGINGAREQPGGLWGEMGLWACICCAVHMPENNL